MSIPLEQLLRSAASPLLIIEIWTWNFLWKLQFGQVGLKLFNFRYLSQFCLDFSISGPFRHWTITRQKGSVSSDVQPLQTHTSQHEGTSVARRRQQLRSAWTQFASGRQRIQSDEPPFRGRRTTWAQYRFEESYSGSTCVWYAHSVHIRPKRWDMKISMKKKRKLSYRIRFSEGKLYRFDEMFHVLKKLKSAFDAQFSLRELDVSITWSLILLKDVNLQISQVSHSYSFTIIFVHNTYRAVFRL